MKAYKVCYVNQEEELESLNHLVTLNYEIGVEVKPPEGSALFLFDSLENARRATSEYSCSYKIFEVEYVPTTLDIRQMEYGYTLIPWTIHTSVYLDVDNVQPHAWITCQPRETKFPHGTIFADSVTLLKEIAR